MSAADHREWRETAGAYVLDALPADERAAFEAHLAGCAACREDVEQLRVAADALPASAPPVAPPPELKARIMAVVESEAALLAAAGERADRPERPERRRRRWSLRTLSPALAAGLAALLVGVGVAGGLAIGGGSDVERTVAAQVEDPSMSMRLAVRDEDSTLEGRGLPAPPPGRVYQVWVEHEDGRVVGTDALFGPARDGHAMVVVPGSLENASRVMVSDEPRGGSRAPTGHVLAVITL
jgi:anti-sigma-K factor RskA